MAPSGDAFASMSSRPRGHGEASPMSRKPDWAVEGRDWPDRASSKFVTAGGLRSHVQDMGAGPTVLLLHGAGAATHSWRGLAPLLARRLRVVAIDLPGHGFTGTPAGMALSLPEMARRVAALIKAMEIEPSLVVGHSAGAAIAIRMALDGAARAPIVAINGALRPFAGMTAPLFQGLATLLLLNPLAAHLFAAQARDRSRVARLIEGTGSRIDDSGLEFYARLFRAPGHVAGTLGMMANWDLGSLQRDLRKLTAPLTLVVGTRDAAVPQSVADDVAASVPRAEIVKLVGLGHLAHEERPDLVADIILRVARAHGLLDEDAG